MEIEERRKPSQWRDDLPTLMIASRVFGLIGQPWMWRQVINLQGFQKELLCWERQNANIMPTTNVYEHILSGNQAPYDTSGRWLYRCRSILRGNFYAAIGEEEMRLKDLFSRRRPDVILCNFGEIAMRLLPSACAAKIPLVAHFHGEFSFVQNRWYRWSLYRCMSDFAAIVVVTAAEREWLINHGAPEERIRYIPCGAPTDIFHPVPRCNDELVRFVMVHRLSEDKGGDISIEAFARIAATNYKVRLDVFGDGSERARLEELVRKLRLSDKVRFHGFIDEARLAKVLPQHDIFIQHSRLREGSPVSIAEAMACGLPVVSTPVGGIPDQVDSGRTGYLVPQDDIAAMAAAMQKLASDRELRAQFGRAARMRAVAHHDSANQTRRLGELLMTVACRNAPVAETYGHDYHN